MENDHKILYVDDELNARKALCRRLRRSSYEIVTAGNGREALQLAQQYFFDAAIIDLWMPKMTGFHVIKALHRIAPDLPVVVLTGLKDDYALFRSVKLGCDGFLEKPYEVEDLEVQLISAIASRKMQV